MNKTDKFAIIMFIVLAFVFAIILLGVPKCHKEKTKQTVSVSQKCELNWRLYE